MPRTFVALDLETTGLSPERDAIIEVGAVRFREGEPIEQYATLVNPGPPLPFEIQQLTGITEADLIGKPRFAEVAAQVERFVGQSPVVGHNVSFDLAFLRAQGLLAEATGMDTWELASVLLPGLTSYSLDALARRYGLAQGTRHRAVSDALATGHLFLQLCEEAAALPRGSLGEINRLARTMTWPLATVFREALGPQAPATFGQNERAGPPSPGRWLERLAPGSPLLQPLRIPEPLEANDRPVQIDVAELAAMLAPDGLVGRSFAGYEHRPPQIAVLEAVGLAFNQQHHLLAEAGTGTGKSMAYLLPAVAFAIKNHARVVVSTNTINLQDQLFKKDLPDLQRILAAAWDGARPLQVALLKGRANYLCPRRLLALMERPVLNADELRGIVRVLVWLPNTQTGDVGELSLPTPGDRYVWAQMAADHEGCTLERCQREMGGRCFFYRAHRQAEAAHILVVNHALLLADAATENRVLPEYHQLIIDEAHHLEDAVTDQLSFRTDSQALGQLFSALHPAGGRGGGLLADVLACLRSGLPVEVAALVRNLVQRLENDAEAVHKRLSDFWEVLAGVLENLEVKAGSAGEYDQRLRITDGVRHQPVWVEIEVSWENLGVTWQTLAKRLGQLRASLQDLLDGGFSPPGLESVTEELAGAERSLAETYAQMDAWSAQPEQNSIYWLEVNAQNKRTSLHAAPLHVGPLVQQHILFRNDTVIMTSATMRTAGSFEYLRERLQVTEADAIAVGSPFDYKESTLLYLPTDVPEPTAPGYQRAVEQALSGLARALNGRTLALFTSNAQLRRTAQGIAPAMVEAGITLLSQGTGISRHQLLELFKGAGKTILLGTRSFWEGVDVVGPALSALVLVRLPFAVPSDPIVAARSETFEDPFYQYSVPDAILRFRQGFGRLIRSRHDRGVVVVLDRRLQSKNYGQLFLDSLPECTVHRGPLMNLPAAAQRWVDQSTGPI